MAAVTTQGSNQSKTIGLFDFLKLTNLQHIPLVANGNTIFADGATITFQQPPTGLLSRIFFSITGTITVSGTVTGGTWNTWTPAPFGLVPNMQLVNNQNVQLRSHSLWGFYTWYRERYGIDAYTAGSTTYTSTANAILGIGVPSIIPGAAVTATTYNVALQFVMPIAYNERMETGLLILQNNNINYPLQFRCGALAAGISTTGGSNDLFTGLTGTSLAITNTLSFQATAEIASIPVLPQGYDNTPRSNMFLSVLEQSGPLLQAGTNQIVVPISDTYTMMMFQVINNGAPINSNKISNIQFQYGGNNFKFSDTINSNLGFDYISKKLAPVDGSFIFDMGHVNGLINQRETYGSFNDQRVTGLQVNYNLPTTGFTPTGTNYTNCIYESLRNVTQV